MADSQAPRRLKLGSVLALLLFTAVSFSQTVDDKPEIKQEVLDKITTTLSESAFVPGVDFSKWGEFLKEEKSEIDAAKNDDEFRTAVNAALHKFGASHVVLLTPRAQQVRRTGATVGIGVSTQMVPDGLSIIRIIKGGAAEKARLQLGDVVTEIEGVPVANAQPITGEEGSKVHIKVKHADGKIEDYTLTRRKYSTIRPAELVWPDKDTAQLKIYSFEAGYDRSAIVDLVRDALKAKNLIVDLRFNGGGAVYNLQQLLGMLIPDGKPVGTFIRRSTVDDYIASTGGQGTDLTAIADWSEKKFKPTRRDYYPMFTGHIVVLVNKFSGSASEIAAAALHDVVGATVIGSKSAGAVLASVIEPVTNGFMLQYPIEDYVTIRGIRLEGNGVTPDIEVPDVSVRPGAPHDEAVERALAYFGQAK